MFEPRVQEDRLCNLQLEQNAVRELLLVFPESSLGHMWDIDPPAPEPVATVEVQSLVGLEECVQQLMLYPCEH